MNAEGQVIGFCHVRHRPNCNEDLPPEAGNNLYYQIEERYPGRGFGKTRMGLALAEARRFGLEKGG